MNESKQSWQRTSRRHQCALSWRTLGILHFFASVSSSGRRFGTSASLTSNDVADLWQGFHGCCEWAGRAIGLRSHLALRFTFFRCFFSDGNGHAGDCQPGHERRRELFHHRDWKHTNDFSSVKRVPARGGGPMPTGNRRELVTGKGVGREATRASHSLWETKAPNTNTSATHSACNRQAFIGWHRFSLHAEQFGL